MEKRIFFESSGFQLEGLIHQDAKNKGVVVTHPHPLFGGDMYNPVVESIVRVYQKKEYSTLRFNFRGTGQSEGKYENGEGETKDLFSALAHMKSTGIEHIDLAGYSFGAWINALAVNSCDIIRKMVMVSPPVGFLDFQKITSIPCLELVVSGGMDDIALSGRIKNWVSKTEKSAQYEIIDKADHFYSGCLDALEAILEKNI